MGEMINSFILESGFANMDIKSILMILIACVFLYLAIKKGYEPYLLIPISVGMLLANMPGADLMKPASNGELGGLLYYLYQGVNLGIFPPVIFLCIGASTDFGPMIANPKTMLLGAAAQFGIFFAFLGAILLGFNGLEAASIGIIGGADGPTAINPKTMLLGAAAQFGIFFAFLGAILLGFNGLEAASIGIIGGADGPTAIQLTSKLAPHMLGTIALAAYSYMALVPVIQPPIIRALTTKEERDHQ